MSLRSETADLWSHHPQPIVAQALRLMEVLAEVRPDLTPSVKRGWGSVNYRHPRAGFVCAVFLNADHVSLVFEHGRLLSSPLLTGGDKVKQVRWIELPPDTAIPVDDIAILLGEAIALRA